MYCSPNIISNQMEKNVMGGICSTYGERRGVYRVLMRETCGEETTLEDPGIDGRIILR